MYEPKSKFIVYCLIDPRNGEVRYVGKSSSGLRRPGRHQTSGGRRGETHNKAWLRQMWDDGARVPMILVLEECDSDAQVLSREIVLIALFREAGFNLTNITDGGEGVCGYRMPPETRAKISASQKGKTRSLETRAKMSARVWTAGSRAKTSASMKVAWASDPERHAAASERAIKRWSDPAARAAQAARCKAGWGNPASKAVRGALSKASWEDPVYRQRVMEAQAASRLKKREAQNGQA